MAGVTFSKKEKIIYCKYKQIKNVFKILIGFLVYKFVSMLL